jgi:hypothetical protein
LAPQLANASAAALPMPDPPPVTMATLLFNDAFMVIPDESMLLLESAAA